MLINEITQGPSRRDVSKHLESLKHVLIGGVDVDDLVAQIQNALSDYNIVVSVEETESVDQNKVAINAFFDSAADQDDEPSVEIVLLVNDELDQVNLDHQEASHFVNELADAVAHELVHQGQYRARDYESQRAGKHHETPEQAYLSNPDEIEAHARNIADDLYDEYQESAKSQLTNLSDLAQRKKQNGYLVSPNLAGYMNAFGDANHPVIRRLVRAIIKYLDSY